MSHDLHCYIWNSFPASASPSPRAAPAQYLVRVLAFNISIVNPAFAPIAGPSSLTLGARDSTLTCKGDELGRQLVVSDRQSAVSFLPKDETGDVYFDYQRRQWVYPQFQSNAPEERHRLPRTRLFGSCAVEVRLHGTAVLEHSSWRVIILRLGNVIDTCVKRHFGTGGAAATGWDLGIEVVVYSASPELTEICSY